MQKVHRHKLSGDLYVVERGQFGGLVSPAGTRFLTLSPVQRLFDRQTRCPVERSLGEEAYAALEDNHALELVVTCAEFASDFEEVPGWGACQNSDIQDLLAQYEAECCDHTDLRWVVQASQRYVQSMDDSQVRCLLHTLAEHVQKTHLAAGAT